VRDTTLFMTRINVIFSLESHIIFVLGRGDNVDLARRISPPTCIKNVRWIQILSLLVDKIDYFSKS